MASGVSRPRLAVLLPMGHRDAELRHNFLQAFDQRRRGERLRLKAVASDSRFRVGLLLAGWLSQLGGGSDGEPETSVTKPDESDPSP